MDWFLYDRDLHYERVKAAKKVENKRNELMRITLYLDQKQIEAFRAILFIQWTFTLLPQIWTFCLRHSNRIINALQD